MSTLKANCERIKTNISNAYAAAALKGATMPGAQVLDNLPTTLGTIGNNELNGYIDNFKASSGENIAVGDFVTFNEVLDKNLKTQILNNSTLDKNIPIVYLGNNKFVILHQLVEGTLTIDMIQLDDTNGFIQLNSNNFTLNGLTANADMRAILVEENTIFLSYINSNTQIYGIAIHISNNTITYGTPILIDNITNVEECHFDYMNPLFIYNNEIFVSYSYIEQNDDNYNNFNISSYIIDQSYNCSQHIVYGGLGKGITNSFIVINDELYKIVHTTRGVIRTMLEVIKRYYNR